MSQPTPYERGYSFTDFSSGSPTSQPPGASIDAELDAIAETLDGVLASLAAIQRDDTRLANDSVGVDQLDNTALSLIASPGFNPRGAWETSTAYILGDMVSDAGVVYLCMEAHTSTVLATDVAADKFVLAFDPANTVLQNALALSTGLAMIGATGGINAQAALDAKAAIGDLASTASTKGAQMIGFKQASGLARTIDADLKDVVKLRRFHAGDGTDATAALGAAITEAQTLGIKRIVAGKGHFLLTNSALPDGFTLEGDGETTRLMVGASNSNVLNLTTDDIKLRGLRFEGDNTSSSSITGNGVYLTGAGLIVEDVSFTGFGHGAIRGYASSAKRAPRIYRAKVRGQGASGHDFYLSGAWQSMLFCDLDCVNTGSADQAIGVFEESGAYWNQIEVCRGWFEGYTKWGIAVSDETWDGTDRVFGMTVRGGYWKDCGMAGIKAKLSKGILIDGAHVEGCGSTLENGPSGLFGAILVNSVGQIRIVNNVVRDAGHGAITTNGNDGPPKGYPQGLGLPSNVVANNIIERVTSPTAGYGNGISMLGRIKSAHIVHNDIRYAERHGVYVDGAQRNGVKHLKSSGNFVGHASTTQYAYLFRNIDTALIDGDEGVDYGGTIASFENIYSLRVGASARYHDSRSGVSVVNIINVTRVGFDGGANCSLYPAWATSTAYTEGQRVNNGGNAYECTTAGTSSNVAGGPAGTDPATVVGDGSGGTAAWTYVHKYRQNTVGLAFSGTAPELARIGACADFSYVTGSSTSGAPTNLRRPVIASGTVTLASGTSTAPAISPNEQDAGYRISLSGDAAETFTWASKAVGGFTINSSNGSSTANVDWVVYR
jgi:hypothetical protein